MAVRPIRLFGDPVLRQQSVPVTDFDRELARLVEDLTDTMIDANGGGIAAPQIGVALRVFTWRVGEETGHVVNPELRFLGEDEQYEQEGCLSIPGMKFDCRRHLEVVTTGFDVHGEPVVLPGSGRLAMIVQHENDHLDGILFVDRLDAEVRAEAERAIAEAEWSGGRVPEIRVSPHAALRAS